MSDRSFFKKFLEIQQELKVEKSQTNTFGGYKYRSKEDILEAAKPLCHKRGILLLCTDEIVTKGNGWTYVICTAKVLDMDTNEYLEAKGAAREPEARKGMDASQITGTAASYAGKRALGNLFAIDDTADADAPLHHKKEPPQNGEFIGKCRSCGTRYTFKNAEQFKNFHVMCCEAPDYEVE